MKVNKAKAKMFVEGIDMTTYRGIADPYHVVGRTSRSVNEAFRGAEYACSIYRHKSDVRHALEFFSEFFMTLLLGGCAIALPILFVLWLTK